ncbi:hypothetical protein ACN47E_006821 [Coniothyrium glycines]
MRAAHTDSRGCDGFLSLQGARRTLRKDGRRDCGFHERRARASTEQLAALADGNLAQLGLAPTGNIKRPRPSIQKMQKLEPPRSADVSSTPVASLALQANLHRYRYPTSFLACFRQVLRNITCRLSASPPPVRGLVDNNSAAAQAQAHCPPAHWPAHGLDLLCDALISLCTTCSYSLPSEHRSDGSCTFSTHVIGL